MFLAECPRCKKKVTTLPVFGGTELRTALEKEGEVRVAHLTPNEGDHVWTFCKQDKKNLLKAIDQGIVKL